MSTPPSLWVGAFAPRDGDKYQKERARLAGAFERMRENVATLVTNIPIDCKDLTVHDVSHLDALWEMASLIAGDKFTLNPAEAFVFGAAVLLHDAGMSVAAFPGGLAEIKATEDWRDITASSLRQSGRVITSELIDSPPLDIIDDIIFTVLRSLHANQAEVLATKGWSIPGNRGTIFLIDDVEMRQAFGSSIGRIAHSHHWDIESVAEKLPPNVGSGVGLPVEWAIDERRIACLLRCADAAHIDRRRAPTIQFAASKPTGTSAVHWGAQNKINKPSSEGSAIIYSSGDPYRVDEADAWWMAFDLAGVADRELRAAHALLEEIKAETFSIQRVLGVDSPRQFSKYLRTDGWRPVDAEIKVSNPVHLAMTLGGRNLYGAGPYAPFRELLQNAVDAVRARRKIDNRDSQWGCIKITVDKYPADPSMCVVTIDDTGIGMSERVMTGPLVDFGKSIWNSSTLREEFPGLLSMDVNPIGKFGIGFFSIFNISKHIVVSSRRYDAGLREAKSLEFRSVATRPILRDSKKDELPSDYSTRIKMYVEISTLRTMNRSEKRNLGATNYYEDEGTFWQSIRAMICNIDVRIEIEDKISPYSIVHDANVWHGSSDDFFDEFLALAEEKNRLEIMRVHSATLRNVVEVNGDIVGRASIFLMSNVGTSYVREVREGFAGLSVGGFVYMDSQSRRGLYTGIMAGATDRAARNSAVTTVSSEAISNWASDQAKLIDQTQFSGPDLLQVSQRIIEMGGDPGPLPYCFYQGKLVSLSFAKLAIAKLASVRIPLRPWYTTSLENQTYANISSEFFELVMSDDVFVTAGSAEKLLNEDVARRVMKKLIPEVHAHEITIGGSSALRQFFALISDIWGVSPVLKMETGDLFSSALLSPPPSQWCLILQKPPQS